MTPKEIDSDVKKLVSVVCPRSYPIFVSVIPEDYAKRSYCFPNVEEKIKRNAEK